MATPVEIQINGHDNTKGAFASATGGLSKIMQVAGGILASQVFTKLAQGAIEFGKSVFTEAMDAQLNMAQLDAVLASTNGTAGVTRQAALDLADSLSTVTRFSDDTILKGENMLLTFTNIGKDIFPQATEAILNMSTGLGQDLQSSAIQLGKALNDPVAGVTALQRVGVKLTDEQKKQVEGFMAVNDIASAQAIILGELQTEFGGSAVAAGKTFAGQMDILKNKVNNLKEGLGLKLMPMIQQLADKLIAFADNPAVLKFFDDLAKGAIKLVEMLVNLPSSFDGIKSSIAPFLPSLKSIMTTFEAMRPTITAVGIVLFAKIKSAIQELSARVLPFVVAKLQLFANWFRDNRPLIVNFITTLGRWFGVLADAIVKFWPVVQPILSALLNIVLGVAKTIMQLATGDWPGAWASMQQIVIDAWEGIKNAIIAAAEWISSYFGGDTFQGMKKTWAANWAAFKLILTQVWAIIKMTVSNGLTAIKTYFTQTWSNIISGARSFASGLVNAIVGSINDAVSGASNALSGFISLGGKIITNIIQGLNNAKASLLNYLKGIITGLVQGLFSGGTGGGTRDPNADPGKGYATGTGGWRTVPAGFNNDNYLIGLTSGEQFNVKTPSQQRSAGGGSSRTSNSYYNAHITIYTGRANQSNAMRGLI